MQDNSEQKPSWFKKTLFYKTLDYCRQKPSYLFLTMIYDLVFVLGLYIINKLFMYLFPPQFSAPTFGFIIVLLIIALSFSLLYSFTKYIILSIIDSFTKSLHLKLESFGFFYLFNTIFFIITFLLLLTTNVFIKTYIKPELITTMQYILFTLLIVLFSMLLSIVHSNFIKKRSMKSALKQTMHSLSHLQTYKPIFNIVIINFIILSFMFLFVYILDKTYLSQLQDFNLYISISFVLFLILVIINYLLHVFNRISFYVNE
ncbi:hypothetical protein HZA96_04630 [Candidatus Woesearchaeota archaeon]|nr:hypothetical protein [Candidatus Woesearchaeota archaeon]